VVAVLGAGAVLGIAAADRHAAAPVYAGSGDDSVLTSTLAHPALQTQGLMVRVQLPHGTAEMTVTGPETPAHGLIHQGDFSAVTWTIHVSSTTTDLPLTAGNFDTVDHLGVIGHPVIAGDTPAQVPGVLHPGQSATFRLTERMAVGEGLIRYSADKTHVLAKWDYEVEID
jgi:hypothetical protein